MNWENIQGKWKQLKGDAKQRWGKLTDDDLTFIDGSKDKFLGRLQERYGYSKEQAQNQVDEWVSSVPNTPPGDMPPRTDRPGAHAPRH